MGLTKLPTFYVTNIAPKVTVGRLKELFSSYGEVDSVEIIRNVLGYSGIAFVNFFQLDPGSKAMVTLILDDYYLEGERLGVTLGTFCKPDIK